MDGVNSKFVFDVVRNQFACVKCGKKVDGDSRYLAQEFRKHDECAVKEQASVGTDQCLNS
jgi:hypothetical protein